MARYKHIAYDMDEETSDETIEKIIRNDLTFDEAMQELKDNSLVSAFFSESEIEQIVSYELKKEVLNYIDGLSTPFEDSPLETLSKINQLNAFQHTGFWYPIDTLREKVVLESEIIRNNGKMPWKND